ncbi:MAG: serine/threonine-protein kinase [Verrucomicrobiota bacterium]
MSDFQPTPAQLKDFLEGNLDESVMEQIEELINEGKISAEELDRISAKSTLMRSIGESVRTDSETSAVLPELIESVTKTFHGLKTIPEPATPPTEFPPEHQLGPHLLKEVIGHGGMSTVYRAFDTKLQRDIAVKVLAPGLTSVPEARERFLREARAAAKLDHDHVLPIHGVSVDDSPPWLAMPLIDGVSLEEKLAETKDPMTVEETRRIGIEVSRGLSAAHENGLVHRDIKPGNILLDRITGRALVADFGLARATEEARLTCPDGLAGTPQFMSPEQINGGPITPKSDLFSLGSMLYFTLAGRPPFEGDSAPAVMQSITNGSVLPLRDAAPSTPKWLAAIVERLLEPDPDRRPESAAKVASLLGEKSSPSGASRRVRRLRRWAVVAAAVILGLGIFLASDLSGRSNTINRFLAGNREHPASIRGQWGTFATITEAIEAAAPGSHIELHGEKPLISEALVFDKPLTLSSAAEEPLVLRHDDSEGHFLRVHAEVSLNGIILLQTPRSQRQRAVIRVENGSLRLTNSRVGYTDRGLRSWRLRNGIPLILLTGEATADLENCLLYSEFGAAFVSRSTGDSGDRRIRFKNSIANTGIFVTQQSIVPDITIDLEIESSTITNRGFYYLPIGSTPPRLTIRGQQNVLEVLSLYASPGVTPEEALQLVDWQMDDNLYGIKNGIFANSLTEKPNSSARVSIEDLRAHWSGGADTNSHVEKFLGIHLRVIEEQITVMSDPSAFRLPDSNAEQFADRGFRKN